MQKVDYPQLKTKLDLNERADFNFQFRRHEQWKENYELFRDTVILNRLTQRQSVNIPLMKGTLKTILSNIDEFPDIEFEELDNNKSKELFFNTLWDQTVVEDKMEVKDIVDKKQQLLYGRTWRKLNIANGHFESEVLEPFDVLVDRYVDPTDLETANHIIHVNIFRTIAQLEADPNYDQQAVQNLKLWYATKNGLITAEQITRIQQVKNERLQDMGVPDLNMPALGEAVMALKAHYVKIWDETDQVEHIHVVIIAEAEILMAKPLMDILNIDFFPFVTWADDTERNDFYSDGVADIVRTPNKVLNVWYSQLIENRTMRGLGMNYYDATASENWVPQSFDPVPNGWVPLPGKPGEVFQKVDFPELEGTLDDMNFVKSLVESATAATATTKGDTEDRRVTLGEVELTTKAAMERINSISKFYMLGQKEFGDKWAKLVNANADSLDDVKLYKKSHKGNWFKKTVKAKDWKSDEGYDCKVVSSAEREQKNIESLQKLKIVMQDFPNNLALRTIAQKKELDFAGLNPDEQKQVMDFEKQNPSPPPGQPPQPGQPGRPGPPGPPGQPAPQPVMQQNVPATQPA